MGNFAITTARYWISCAVITAFASCEKVIDFKYHDIEPITVIEATVDRTGARVALSATTPMGEMTDTTLYTDADVCLTDLTEGTTRYLTPNAQGLYRDAIPGISGHTYRISIEREGRNYISDCLMPEDTEITGMRFEWVKMPYDNVAALQIAFRDIADPPGDCYWIRIYRNGQIYKWTVTTDAGVENGVIYEAMRTSRRNLDKEDEKTALHEGDIVTAKVCPVSRNMYDYLTAISNDSNGTPQYYGDFCLGYFLASPISSSSIVFHTDELK